MSQYTSTRTLIDRKFDVTLAGDCNLDLMLYGLPKHLPPERELLASEMVTGLGGSAAITAHNLARLGNSVGLISRAAQDCFGSFCRENLNAAGVDTSRAVFAREGKTGVSVLLQHEEYRRLLTYPGITNQLRISDLDLDYLASASHFHLSSYYLQEALTEDIPRLLAQLKRSGMTISMDPNDDPSERWDSSILGSLQFVDVLLPNEREACRMAGTDDVDRAIATLRALVPLLVVKRGTAGAIAFSQREVLQVDAHPVRAVDAVGAGDSFNAGFLHGHLRGWPLMRCMQYGSLTGAWSTTKSGGTAAFSDEQSREGFFAEWIKHDSSTAGC